MTLALGLGWVVGGGILGLLIVAMWIAGLVDVIGRKDLERSARMSWILLIVLLPVAGTLIYFVKRPTSQDEVEKIAAAQMHHRP